MFAATAHFSAKQSFSVRDSCECDCECEREYLTSVQIGCASDVSHLSYKLELKTTANFGPPTRPRAASRPSSLSYYRPLSRLDSPHMAPPRTSQRRVELYQRNAESTCRDSDLNITAIDTDVGAVFWSASFASPVFRFGSGRWRWQRRLNGWRGLREFLHLAPGAALARCGTAARARAVCCTRAIPLSTGDFHRRERRQWAGSLLPWSHSFFSRRSTAGRRP